MPTQPLTSPLYGHIEAAAIEAFCSQGKYTQAALAERIASVTGEDAWALARRLPAFLNRLQQRGHYIPQDAAFGSKVGHPGALTSPRVFNWSTRPADAPALATLVAEFIADNGVDGARKSAARSALRLVLELPTKCDNPTIVAACERVAADELYHLPIRAFECALARHLDKQTAKNHRTALRGLLKYGGERRLIPLVFPLYRPESPWDALRDRFLPLAATGRTAATVLTLRRAWTVLEMTAKELLGADVQFADLSRGTAEQVVDHLLLVVRRRADGYSVRRLCRHIAATYKEGPFAEAVELDRFSVETPSGRHPALYLQDPHGITNISNWAEVCAMLSTLGFPETLVDFLQWYRKYVTLSAIEILSDPAFPPRRQRHRISEKTTFERLTALRALLGAAVNRLEIDAQGSCLGLGLSPGELTPEVLFGERFQRLLQIMIAWWRARAAHLPAGAVGKRTSGALRQMIINLGMFAFGHYERLRHQRNLASASRMTVSGIEVLDSATEERVDKTAAEKAAWDAYDYANKLADALTDLVRDGRGRSRKRSNEFRSIKRILKTTPPSFWIDLQGGMIEQTRLKRRMGEDTEYAYHALVLNAVLLGLLISTGCRIEELCLVRLDVQFSRRERVIEPPRVSQRLSGVRAGIVPFDRATPSSRTIGAQNAAPEPRWRPGGNADRTAVVRARPQDIERAVREAERICT